MPASTSVKQATKERQDPFALVALLFHLIPKNFLSFIIGSLSRLALPTTIQVFLNKAFVWVFRINMMEAEKSIEKYRTLEDVFTRKIDPATRPVAGPVCSPADGYLVISASAQTNQAVQAKGLSYDLEDLVLGESSEPHQRLDLAWYQTFYLAPHNYHRVHAPVGGSLTRVRYFPGELWPVNPAFVKRLPRLFNRNERLVFEITHERGRVYVAMVGAMNVGRIYSSYFKGYTNDIDRLTGARPSSREYDQPIAIRVGEELGTFMLGSTVIVVYDRSVASAYNFVRQKDEQPILMGQSVLI